MAKKLTVKELIEKKTQLKNKKMQTVRLYLDSFDAEIVVSLPSTSIILEAQELGEEDAIRADKYLIFQCVKEPNLKDEELLKEYGCAEPIDIVEEIFLPGEISTLASKIMKLAGFGTNIKRVGKDIKN